MKRLTMILAATMIFLTLGCERRVGQAKDADRFDEKIDGPVCVLTVSADENLLADQRKISRQAKLDAETPAESEERTDDEGTTPSPTPAPAGDPISAVKQVLGEAISAAKSSQPNQVLKFYTDADATAIKAVVGAAKKTESRMAALEKLVQDKLGLSLPNKMKEITQQKFYTPATDLALLNMDELKFETKGPDVIVTDPGNLVLIFTDTPGGWKIQLDQLERDLESVQGDVLAGLDKIADEMTTGINSGTITKDNFQTKADEMRDKYISAAMEKAHAILAKIFAKFPAIKPEPKPKPKRTVVPRRRHDERPLMPGERRR